MQLDLHEEGLSLFSSSPIMAVVHLGGPVKIVIRLSVLFFTIGKLLSGSI